MKKSCVFLLFIALLISCNENNEKKIESISASICNVFKKGINSEIIKKAESTYLAELKTLNNEDLKNIQKQIDDNIVICLKSKSFSKTIPQSNYSEKIEGNCSNYIKIIKKDYNIELKSGENPAFSILLEFENTGQKKILSETISGTGSIYLLDKKKELLSVHTIYFTPDLKKLLNTPFYKAQIRINLNSILNSLSGEGIFNYAYYSFKTIEACESFRIALNLNNNSKSSESEIKKDSEYEELLKKVDKK